VIRIEDEGSCPWVTFRKAGDAEAWIARYATGKVFQQASEVRQLARPHTRAQTAPVVAVQLAVEADYALTSGATELRRLLRPFAFAIEGTELFRRAGEIKVEAEERCRRKGRG
jgi:hypothetical protein